MLLFFFSAWLVLDLEEGDLLGGGLLGVFGKKTVHSPGITSNIQHRCFTTKLYQWDKKKQGVLEKLTMGAYKKGHLILAHDSLVFVDSKGECSLFAQSEATTSPWKARIISRTSNFLGKTPSQQSLMLFNPGEIMIKTKYLYPLSSSLLNHPLVQSLIQYLHSNVPPHIKNPSNSNGQGSTGEIP